MKATTSLTLASIAAILAGCATAPPPEARVAPSAPPRTEEAVQTTSAEVPRAEASLASLARVAVVQREAQGTVITVPVSSLFLPGESTLRPEATGKLDRIATVLAQQTPGTSFEVDARTLAGDTDISTKRAETVREHLVNHGVSADSVRARGLSPDGENADVRIIVYAP